MDPLFSFSFKSRTGDFALCAHGQAEPIYTFVPDTVARTGAIIKDCTLEIDGSVVDVLSCSVMFRVGETVTAGRIKMFDDSPLHLGLKAIGLRQEVYVHVARKKSLAKIGGKNIVWFEPFFVVPSVGLDALQPSAN